jgi:autotransporter-associated beta strand protein
VNSFTGIQIGNNTAGGVTTFNVLKAGGELQVNASVMDGMNAAGTATVASGLTKTGPGSLYLTDDNTYTGITTISAGILIVNNMNDGGVAGGVGMTSNTASNLIINGGTLNDAASGDVTNRLFTIGTNGGEVDVNGNATFTNTGAIALAGTNTARTFTLGGGGTGSLAATLGNNGTGLTSLVKTGTGTWSLSSAQSYTGGTTVRGGGNLQLDFTTANSPASNIIPASTPLTLSCGMLSVLGSNTTNSTQTFSGLTLNGSTGIQATAGTSHSVTVNLGAITRNAGSTALFTLPGSAGIFTPSGSAGSLLTDASGVPYGVIGDDWAAKDATNAQIVPGSTLAGFYSSALSGNAQITSSAGTSSGTTQLTSLYLGSNANIAVASGGKLLTPGILVTSSSNSTISGGTLGSPAGELVIFVGQNGQLTLANGVADAGHVTALTKSGQGGLILRGNQTYTGATYLIGGSLQLQGTLNTPTANITVDGLYSQGPFMSVNNGSITAANLLVGVNGIGYFYGNPNGQVTIGQNVYLATASGSSALIYLGQQSVLQATSIVGGQGLSQFYFQGGALRANSNTTELFTSVSYITGGGTGFVDPNGNNAVSISQPLQGTWNFSEAGAGTVSLSAANAYSGNASANGGTLRLDFSHSGAPLTNILPVTNPMLLNNGTLAIQGSNSTASSQSFNILTPYGASAVKVTSGTGGATTLSFGISASSNMTVDFTLPSNGAIQPIGSYGANNILTYNGYDFATVNGNDWAAMDTTGTRIVAGSSLSGFYTPATATSLSGNADVPLGMTSITLPASPAGISSLRFNQAQAGTLTIGSSDTLKLNGLLVTSAVGNRTIQVSGGTLQGNGSGLSLIQNNTAGPLNISSNINSPFLIKSGPGAVTLSGTVQNSGALSVVQGSLTISGPVQGGGSILIDGPLASPASVTLASGGSISGSSMKIGDLVAGSFIQNSGTIFLTSQVSLGNYYNYGSNASYTLNSGFLYANEVIVNNSSSVTLNGGQMSVFHIGGYSINDTLTVNAGLVDTHNLNWSGNVFQTGGAIAENPSNGSGYSNGVYQQSGGNHSIGGSWTLYTPGSYQLSGTGTLNVYGNETLYGSFVQNGGTHTVYGPLSTNNGASYNLNGGTLQIVSTSQGNFYLNGGTLRFVLSSGSTSGNLYVQSGGAIIDSNGLDATINDLEHDSSGATPTIDGGLTKIGAGNLFLEMANYTGPTKVLGGSLTMDAYPYLNTGSGVINVGSGGTLNLSHGATFGVWNSANAIAVTIEAGGTVTNSSTAYNTIYNLTINGGTLESNGGFNGLQPSYQLMGTVMVGGTGASAFTVGSNPFTAFTGIQVGDGSIFNGTTTISIPNASASLTIAPALVDSPYISGGSTNPGGITKTGLGTLILTGASTYTGPTNVYGGKVALSGSLNGTANVRVGDGVHPATLAGNGSIALYNNTALTVANGATLAPGAGNASGLSLSVAYPIVYGPGSLVFQSGSTLQLSMANNQAGAPSLNDYSKLTIGTGIAATLGGNIVTSFDGPLHNGDLFTIILLNGGTFSGTFANTTTAAPNSAGSTFRFSSNGLLWDINYAWNGSVPLAGMDPTAFEQVTGGNNVALLLVQVPEPGVVASLLGGAALLLGYRRRRVR